MQFREIIGQARAKEAVLSAIRGNHLAHALILKGQEGIGKLAFANAIAQFVNCENPTENDSCGVCASCSKIRKGIHPDIRYVLPIISTKVDGKSPTTEDYFAQFREKFFRQHYFTLKDWTETLKGENKQLGIHIHEIRELKRRIQLKAFEARFKVVIFWNAEKINTEAANALLKLLEEPPDRTLLILTVTDPTQLLTTINSRCQRVQMHRIPEEELAQHLQSAHGVSAGQAMQVATLAEGSVSRALDLVTETNRSLSELYTRWLRACWKGDYQEIQKWVEQMASEDREFMKMYMAYALQKLRDSLLFVFQTEQLALVTAEEREFQRNFSKHIQLNGIEELARLMEDSLNYISRNANPQMVLSVLSLRIHNVLMGRVLV
jgi:DNA polymerase-3 subunit delta'